jgi:predicted  nucleic acid-binding Zn-ribbon protein
MAKQITTNEILKKINSGFNSVDKNFEKIDLNFKKLKLDHDDMLEITKTNFQDLEEKINNRFNGVESRIYNLEQGQEEIKMKLDNIVFRFEYDELKRDYSETKRKVDILEKVLDKIILKKRAKR